MMLFGDFFCVFWLIKVVMKMDRVNEMRWDEICVKYIMDMTKTWWPDVGEYWGKWYMVLRICNRGVEIWISKEGLAWFKEMKCEDVNMDVECWKLWISLWWIGALILMRVDLVGNWNWKCHFGMGMGWKDRFENWFAFRGGLDGEWWWWWWWSVVLKVWGEMYGRMDGRKD